MKPHYWLSILIVLLTAASAARAQIPPPDTGKLGWGLFETASEMLQRSDRGEQVPDISALLVSAAEASTAQARELEDLGYAVEAQFGHFTLVHAPGGLYLDRDRGIDTVSFVTTAILPPATIQNEHQTSGVAVIGAETLHEAGHTGSGTTVAVIDQGFDPDDPALAHATISLHLVDADASSGRGYAVRDGQVARVDCHGTACAAIVADVAPDAALHLISFQADLSIVGWLYALDYAVTVLGADIVTSSLEFSQSTCHADGTGPLNADVADILTSAESLLVLAAGNWAQGGENGRTFYAASYTDADEDWLHDFTPEAATAQDRNTLRFSGRRGDRVEIIMEWDDWDRRLGVQDLDLILSIAGYEQQVSASRGRQHGSTLAPVEIIRIELPYTADYCLAVENRASRWYGEAVEPVSFHIYIRNLSHSITFVEHHSVAGSVREVATSPHVLTVGAYSVEDETLQPYTSRGPTSDGRDDKPEICAPSAVTGTCYGIFHGTSAAAPYAAGALSLLRSAFPDLSCAEVRTLLLDTARCSVDTHGTWFCAIDLRGALSR